MSGASREQRRIAPVLTPGTKVNATGAMNYLREENVRPVDLLQKIESTRRADTRHELTAETRAAKESERQRRERIREENRILWAAHHWGLAASHIRLAQEHMAKGAALEQGLNGE